MLTLSNFQPGDLPWTNTRGAHWIAGPPLPADLFAEDDTTGPQWALPPAERLSARRKDAEEYPNRVKRFIDGFDTVDAELRLRMARLGIGQIGSDASGGAPGCVVCLEKFGEEDAEWLADTSTLDQQVVVAPCGGFHAFHRGCLIKTLESVHSWRSWACPMCRAKLRDEEGKKKEEEEEAAGVGRAARGRGGVVATAAGVVTAAMATAAAMMSSSRGKAKPPTVLRVAPTSLREEIRRREQERGYVCDYPACYPTYGELPPTPPADDKDSYARLSAQVDRRLITLKPCGHQVHRECLLLELSAEGRQTLADSAEEDEGASGDDDSSDSVGGTRSDVASAELDQPEQRSRHQPLPTVHEVGRWVKCCVDRKGAWAMIPVVKKGNSITGEEEGSAEVSSSSEQRRLDKGKGKAKA